jgi:thiamine-monophosphate kinase
MKQSKQRARVADIDEFRLIAALQGILPREPSWVKIGRGRDDGAVLDLGGRLWLVWTCDALVEGVHFRQPWLSARQLGRRAASVNLSDVAAMGAQPLAALASLHLPASYPESDYRQLMRGLGEQLAAHGASLVGGNLSRSARLSIDVSLLGQVRAHQVAQRGGAQVGDRVLVTGFPGEAAAGLHALRRQSARGKRPVKLQQRWIAPTPRVEAGQLLLGGGISSMIDISDGLQADLEHLCNASRVGVEIDVQALPVSTALRRYATQQHLDARQWLLGGGEDYELLCTAAPRRAAALRRRLQQVLGVPLTDIGRIVPAGSGRWLRDGDRRQSLQSQGHRHFGRPGTGRTPRRGRAPRTVSGGSARGT